MARMDLSASELGAKKHPTQAIVHSADKRDEEQRAAARSARSAQSPSSQGLPTSGAQPALEPHAALSADLHQSYGNTLIQAALAGSLEGPAPLINAAMTFGMAGLGNDSASAGPLSNSAVGAWMAAREEEEGPQSEIFARDADSRVRTAAARGGKALPEAARARLESAFGGVDFSGVRIHADGAAAHASHAINAKAYTVGEHVYFGQGNFDLQDPGSMRLLLHELTHVVQHYEGRLRASAGGNETDGGMAVSSTTDAVEVEAESMASALLPSFETALDAPLAPTELLGAEAKGAAVSSQGEGVQSVAPAMRSQDDDSSVQDKQTQGSSQNEDEVDGRSSDQEALEGLGEWRTGIKAAAEKMHALRDRIGGWDALDEAERKVLWRQALGDVLALAQLSLKAIGAALDSSDAGIKLGAKLQGVGSLLTLVGWALNDQGPSTGEVKDERTKENKDQRDPSERRFGGLVGWVAETTGEDQAADFGQKTLLKVLEGARKLEGAMSEFLAGVEDLRSGVDELKQVKDEKKSPAAKDSRKLDQGQLEKVVAQLSERGDALGAKLSGDAQAQSTPDSETETSSTADKPSTDVAGLEQEDAALNGLQTATIKAHGATLRNAPKHLKIHWAGQLEAGDSVGVDAPLRAWSKVKVLDGENKGMWGYVDRHFFKAQNREPGRAELKEKRLTKPTNETLHRSASGPMDRDAVSERPTGPGQALPNKLKEMFRPILGRSIDAVRTHSDRAAGDFSESVAAKAVTVGRDIYVSNKCTFDTSAAGLTLLAEELHHAVLGGGKPGVSQPGDSHERQASAFAKGVVSGGLLEVIDATFGETLDPHKAQGKVHHPRRALQGLKGALPTGNLRRLGDALGTSQGTGLKPGAPGVGLPELGVGGTPKAMRAPKLQAPKATPTPDQSVANRAVDTAKVDDARRAQMDKTFNAYENLSFTLKLTAKAKGKPDQKVTVKVTGFETPYRINGGNVEAPFWKHSKKTRRRMPKDSKDVRAAKQGKATPGQVQGAIQQAINQGKIGLKIPAAWLSGGKLTKTGGAKIRARISSYLNYKEKAGRGKLLGVDCSGFTFNVISDIARSEGHKGSWINGPNGPGTSSMASDKKNLRTISRPSEMRVADLMLKKGHVLAIYRLTAMDKAGWKKVAPKLPFPKVGGVWMVETRESSPSGGDYREGTKAGTWYVMETTRSKGKGRKKKTSHKNQWFQKAGGRLKKRSITVRRAKLLEQTEQKKYGTAPGAIPKSARGTVSRDAKGTVARDTRVPLPSGGGRPLPAKLLSELLSTYGPKLKQVRIHTGKQAQAAAEAISANAFTHGVDIFFNKGMFDPGSSQGMARLAEELHHAIQGGGSKGVSQPGDSHEQQAKAFAAQVANPEEENPSLEGGSSSSGVLSREEQTGGKQSAPPDLSGYTDQQLDALVFGTDRSLRYNKVGPNWVSRDSGGVSAELFDAAYKELGSRGKLQGVHMDGGGMGQTIAGAYASTGTGMFAEDAARGAVNMGGNFAGTPGLTLGRDQITEFKTARDGRRYALATGADGKNVVVWGTRESSDEDLRARADAQLAGNQAPRGSAWERTEKEVVLLSVGGQTTFGRAEVTGDEWSKAEGVAGSTTSGSYNVLSAEAGGDSKAEITTQGATAHAAATAKAELVQWKQKWEWETPALSLLGEDFSATFFVSIDAFVGVEARAQITAKIERSQGQRSVDGDEILSEMSTTTRATGSGTETTGTGPTAQVDASAGVFAGARVRLGAGMAANWVKKDQGAYSDQIQATVGGMIDSITSSVPGLGWMAQQVGADQVAKGIINKFLTWGAAGPTPVLGVEGTGEGSIGVGAQIAGKIGFSGGKFSMEFGANATWGVGLGAKVSVTVDVLEGVKLALIVGGRLYDLAKDKITEWASDLGELGAQLWAEFWSWFSADDKVREAVANQAHELADANQRGEMIKTLMSGWTGDEDQSAMVQILATSKRKGDLSAVLAVADKDDVASELDGVYYRLYQRLLSMPEPKPAGASRNPKGPIARDSSLSAPRGGGQALPPQVYSKLFPIFGKALDNVRIHLGSEAQAFAQGLNANAVTQGTHIYFNKATFDPGSAKGMELITEELHHAIVGGGGPGVSQPGDAHEKEAKGLAAKLVGGRLLDTIDGLLAEGGGARQSGEAMETAPMRVLGQLSGALPPAIASRLGQQLGVQGGDSQSQVQAQGTQGASRQEQTTTTTVPYQIRFAQEYVRRHVEGKESTWEANFKDAIKHSVNVGMEIESHPSPEYSRLKAQLDDLASFYSISGMEYWANLVALANQMQSFLDAGQQIGPNMWSQASVQMDHFDQTLMQPYAGKPAVESCNTFQRFKAAYNTYVAIRATQQANDHADVSAGSTKAEIAAASSGGTVPVYTEESYQRTAVDCSLAMERARSVISQVRAEEWSIQPADLREAIVNLQMMMPKMMSTDRGAAQGLISDLETLYQGVPNPKRNETHATSGVGLDLTQPFLVGALTTALNTIANQPGEQGKLSFHGELEARVGTGLLSGEIQGLLDLSIGYGVTDTLTCTLAFDAQAAGRAGISFAGIASAGVQVSVGYNIAARFQNPSQAASWLYAQLGEINDRSGGQLIGVQANASTEVSPVVVSELRGSAGVYAEAELGGVGAAGELMASRSTASFSKDGEQVAGERSLNQVTGTLGASYRSPTGWGMDAAYTYTEDHISGDANRANDGDYKNHAVDIGMALGRVISSSAPIEQTLPSQSIQDGILNIFAQFEKALPGGGVSQQVLHGVFDQVVAQIYQAAETGKKRKLSVNVNIGLEWNSVYEPTADTYRNQYFRIKVEPRFSASIEVSGGVVSGAASLAAEGSVVVFESIGTDTLTYIGQNREFRWNESQWREFVSGHRGELNTLLGNLLDPQHALGKDNAGFAKQASAYDYPAAGFDAGIKALEQYLDSLPRNTGPTQ